MPAHPAFAASFGSANHMATWLVCTRPSGVSTKVSGLKTPVKSPTPLPFLSVEVSVTRHCTTSAVPASSSSGVSLGSVPCTVFRQSVQVAKAKLPTDVTQR